MRLIGRGLTICGAILVVVFIVAKAHTLVGANVALAQFAASSSAAAQSAANTHSEPDTTLWSEGRVKAFRDSLGLTFDPPLAVLRIPRLGLEAPVLPGSDEASLNRGLGWIKGMKRPGEHGNVGVSGHRDGFFRVLKDVAEGDVIELATEGGTVEYVVTSMEVIDPGELRVLAPTERPVLTLVTCYPFYYVGSAPQRFIVKAIPRSESTEAAHGASVLSEGDSAALLDPRTSTGGSHQPSNPNPQPIPGGKHQ